MKMLAACRMEGYVSTCSLRMLFSFILVKTDILFSAFKSRSLNWIMNSHSSMPADTTRDETGRNDNLISDIKPMQKGTTLKVQSTSLFESISHQIKEKSIMFT